jgi:O-antigen ligase
MRISVSQKSISWFALVCVAVGLLTSRALLSSGTILFIANSIINPSVKKYWNQFRNDRVSVALTFIFFIYLFSGIYCTDAQEWLFRIRTKLPFLLLPFSFYSLYPLKKIELQRYLYFFFFFMLGAAIINFFNYLQHYSYYNSIYSYGNVIPTPINHLRFSSLISFDIFIGVYLFSEKFFLFQKWERIFIFIGVLFLLAFLHIMAVRSGLLGFYLCILYFFIKSILERKWRTVFICLACFFLLPLISYYSMPTIKSKVNYTRYDINSFANNASSLTGLSDASRLLSYEKSIELIKQHPWIGISAGNVIPTFRTLYSDHPEVAGENRQPLNEFLFICVATGIIGLLIFSYAIIQPLWFHRRTMGFLFASFNIIILSSFLSDITVEEQWGICIYLLFTLLFHQQLIATEP